MKPTLRILTGLVCLLSLALPVLAEGGGVVNINTATAEQLQMLPRVGPALAQRIIDYREANGGFESKDDLMLVRGIGERTFALMEPHVVVEGETTLAEKVRTPRSTAES